MQHEYEKFLRVVEEGGFNDAAQKLHISQPALSIAIKNLEKDLGTQLLYRSARGVKLTSAGEIVYRYANRMRITKNNLLQHLGEEMKSSIDLKVGAIDSIGKLIIDTSSRYLKTNLELSVDNTSRLIDAVSRDRLDVAFVTMPRQKDLDEVKVEVLGREKFIFVCTPPLAKSISSEIKKTSTINNFLAYDKSSNTSKLMHGAFKEAGIKTSSNFFSTSPDLIKLMAMHGRGVALLPELSVQANLKNGTLARLNIIKFVRPIATASLKGKYISKDMQVLINNLKKELN